ncbi:hypothetical protein GTP38_21010 [Duganella sp. FT94W]|uniref:Uncharacterized protein n=1 Tax=Duganella lactea TaxID=2692173 RepID=A0ABW9VB03_9BURK|nr:hypothetical protein [Duganella lactea]MYM36816.1 hypothetical protein [Duganella lactea]
MNDRPSEPVQETMSDEDFAMIVQEMITPPRLLRRTRPSHCGHQQISRLSAQLWANPE